MKPPAVLSSRMYLYTLALSYNCINESVDAFRQVAGHIEKCNKKLEDYENIRNYILNLIDIGSVEEKRKIIQAFSNQFVYTNKKLSLV